MEQLSIYMKVVIFESWLEPEPSRANWSLSRAESITASETLKQGIRFSEAKTPSRQRKIY
jgi:hypothetical protein